MFEFPKEWTVGNELRRLIDSGVDWMIVSWDPFFSAINQLVLWVLVPAEKFLTGSPPYAWLPSWVALPWWLGIMLVVYLGWKKGGKSVALLTTVMFLTLAFLGLYTYSMQTIAIVFTATMIAIGLGLPIGILASRHNRFNAVLKPFLDAMQTMPSFVYLVPAIMLFGIGKTPAVLATVIYAVPPLIRLTNLGIRQVDKEVVEAAIAFGSTPMQLLKKVQLPMALPTIMAGINQCIMMALAMVVICSMIGAKGLGTEVLNGIARLEVGRGFLGGLGIVFLAIIIDRITQGFAKGRQTQKSD